MKLRIAILLVAFGTLVSPARATNCCGIQVGALTDSQTLGTVSDGNGHSMTYVVSETQTYPLACINSQTAKSCNSTNVPNNVTTATGYAKYDTTLARFVICNPSFVNSTTAQTDTTGASFKNIGTSFQGSDAGGNCVATSNQSVTTTTCVIVACSGGGGGTGGCGKDGGSHNCGSPILIDVTGDGFFLTSAEGGVSFDISGSGNPVQIAWTAKGAGNAFLALPGTDGLVHNGLQLFGNFTPQPSSDHPNGFAALAVYDDPKNGGNGDGVIDARDAVFASLRLWIDKNHDGIAQPDELYTLLSLGVHSISLLYREDRRTDQYGNVFRYRARVNGEDVGKTAYDVFLVEASPAAKNGVCPIRSVQVIPARAGNF